MLAELTNANIPFISVPLPSSADNHQFKNAIYFERKNLAFVIEEQNLNDEVMHLIKKIHISLFLSFSICSRFSRR